MVHKETKARNNVNIKNRKMCDHSEAVYKNSCVKLPTNKTNRQIHNLEAQVRKLSIDSTESEHNKSDKQKIKSFQDFYDSIPEYDDINHLSNKDFYMKLNALREKQRLFYKTLVDESTYGDNVHSSWRDNYKSLNNCRNSIIKSKTDDESVQKPPSRRSVRIESPEIFSENRCKSRANISSAGSRYKSKKSPYYDSTLDELSDCSLTTKSAPCSPKKTSNIAWKKENDYEGTTPETFKMTVRDEDDRIIDQMLINNKNIQKSSKTSLSNSEMFRANPVPIESRIPLFDKIMHDQERRREQVKRQSKAALKSQMRLFSFTKREEELADITRRLSKSSPDLFMCVEKKPKQFKAKPVPKNLFSNYVYRKMHEDQYYRSLQKKIRAEEMLKAAALPPSMAKREKSQPKINMCSKSFREMYERQICKLPPSTQRDLGKELAELELDFIMATPSPVCKPSNKVKTKKKHRKASSSSSKSSGKSSRSASTVESINRSNLAAVLRFQNSRKRMEEEINRRLDEVRMREEARWREKVLRKRPVWQSLAYSHEEDLNMRLQMRRDEERLRSEEFKMQMQSMLGRVNQQPTLFERQTIHKPLKTREDLMAQLHDDILLNKSTIGVFLDNNASASRSTSNSSVRKCIEMKDEAIQAKFDEMFGNSEDVNEQTSSKTHSNSKIDDNDDFDE